MIADKMYSYLFIVEDIIKGGVSEDVILVRNTSPFKQQTYLWMFKMGIPQGKD